MSQSEIMQKLMGEMSNDHAWYLGYIGILVTLVIAFVGLIGYLQLRLSDKQIEKIKNGIREDIHKEYPMEEFEKISRLEQALSSVSQSRFWQLQQFLLEADVASISAIYVVMQRFVEELMTIEIVNLSKQNQELLFVDLKQLVSAAAAIEPTTSSKEKHYAELLNSFFTSIQERFLQRYGKYGYDENNDIFKLINERLTEFQNKQGLIKGS